MTLAVDVENSRKLCFLKKTLWIFAGSHVGDRPLSIIPQRILFKDGEWRDVPVDGQRVINHRILKRMSVLGHNAGLHDI